MEAESFEGQRTGRNKSTQINHAYIICVFLYVYMHLGKFCEKGKNYGN